jgi:hypothetical protein
LFILFFKFLSFYPKIASAIVSGGEESAPNGVRRLERIFRVGSYSSTVEVSRVRSRLKKER